MRTRTGAWIVVALGLAAAIGALWPRGARPVRPAADAGRIVPAATAPVRAAQPPARGASSPATVRLEVRWGTRPGELGHRRDPESAPEGPMALVAGAAGDTWVLDQVNGRVVRFDAAGEVLAEIHVPETTQDFAVGPGDRLVTLDRIGRAEVTVFDAAGAPVVSDAVVGGPISEGGAVTAIFVDDRGVFLEREHTDAVRIAGPDGRFTAERPIVPGRPSRDGTAFIQAALAGRRAPVVNLSVLAPDATPRWQRAVAFPRGVLHIVLLDTDRAGHLFVGAEVADEALVPPYPLDHLATVVLRLALADGADLGALTLPAATAPEEMRRTLAVTDAGEVVQMLPSDTGVRVTSYRFPENGSP